MVFNYPPIQNDSTQKTKLKKCVQITKQKLLITNDSISKARLTANYF